MRGRIAVVAPVPAGFAPLGIGGGTYAAFSDSESAAPTPVGAGTLDLRPAPAAGPDGDPEHHGLVRLTNDGTASVAEPEHGCNAPELNADGSSCGASAEEGELGGQLQVSSSPLTSPDRACNPRSARARRSRPRPIPISTTPFPIRPKMRWSAGRVRVEVHGSTSISRCCRATIRRGAARRHSDSSSGSIRRSDRA